MRDRGIVLINALIIVAALAGAAVLVISKAEHSVARRMAAREAIQLSFYLDSFADYGISVLQSDNRNTDHLREPWAMALFAVPIDRGNVAGQIQDLQGRFNLNWLADTENQRAYDGFGRLAARLALPPSEINALLRVMSGQSPRNKNAYMQMTPPRLPPNPPLAIMPQLHGVAGLSEASYQKLQPYVAMLPADSRLNMNTALPEVLSALFPEAGQTGVDGFLAQRKNTPYEDPKEIASWLAAHLDTDAMEKFDLDRLSLSTDWFLADVTASLGEVARKQTLIFHRRPLPHGTHVAYRYGNH